MNESITTDKKESDILEFVVTNKQLIGEPWKASNGEMMQNILFADGWFINRPVKKLHAAENNKWRFYLSKKKRNGSENQITLRRNVPLNETNENGKPKYKQEKLTVPVAELPDILNYAREKYKFKKAQNTKPLYDEAKNIREVKEYQVTELFVMDDLGCSTYAIKDNVENVYLKDRDKEPYCFTSEQMARIFAEKANVVAKDGLAIRMYKEKEYALCRIAVQANGCALAFIQEQTMEMVLDALNQNPNAIVLVNEEYQTDAAAVMPELIFNKMLRGEVSQEQVIPYLFSLDNKEDYTISITTVNGMAYVFKAENIGTPELMNEDGSCSYVARCDDEDIVFTNRDIGEVQYKGFTAAFYETPADKERLKSEENFVQPRHRHAKVV